MCGILGVIVKEKKGLDIVRKLYKIYLNQKTRGVDGAGVAILRNGNLRRIRETNPDILFSVKYYNFWKQIQKGDCFIFHHRFPTQGGNGEIVEANHPISNEEGDLMLIHNGIISNNVKLYKELIKCGHEFETTVNKKGNIEITDSEVIIHLLEKFNETQKAVRYMSCKVEGSIAIAFMKENQESIWLYRETNPIEVFDDDMGNLFFASEMPEGEEWNKVSEIKEGYLYNLNINGLRNYGKMKKIKNYKNYYNKKSYIDYNKSWNSDFEKSSYYGLFDVKTENKIIGMRK